MAQSKKLSKITKANQPKPISKERAKEITEWKARRELLTEAKRKELDNALITAVVERKNDEIIRLIRADANIAATDSNGSTTLHWAARYGRTEIANLLLDRYAEHGGSITELINKQSKYDSTALYLAERYGNTKTVAFLESYPVFVNFMGKDRETFKRKFDECIKG